MEVLWSALRIAAGVYIGMSLLVMFRQSHYVYYPDKRVTTTPAVLGMPFEDVRLQTADGETLGAWFVPARESTDAPTVLFCHGNAGNIAHRVDSIRTFYDMGFSVLIFDYRGYGTSTGKPTENGTYLDAQAAWEFLSARKAIPPERIVIFGRSLGGSVASWLATRVQPRALVLESTFTSAPDMAKKMFPFLPVRWLTRFRYDSLVRMPKITCPVLVAHSRQDEMIPFAMGQRLFEAAGEPKQFVAFAGSHNAGGLDIHPEYQRAFTAFVTAAR